MRQKGREIHWEDTGYNQYLYVRKIDGLPFKDEYCHTNYYEVVSRGGNVVLYLAKDNQFSKNEVNVFYRNGEFYGGCGRNFAEAIKFAIREAIYYMKLI